MKLIDLLRESDGDTPYRVFSKHRNNRKVFATYTTRPTMQINTIPKFDTPFGLYTYPLEYLMRRGDSKETLFNVAPFASNKKHIHAVEVVSSKVVDLQTYSKYGRDFDTLEEYVIDKYGDDAWGDIEDEFYPRGTAGRKTWDLVTTISKWVEENEGKKQSETSMKLFHNVLGWDGAIDNGGGIIHEDEPTQAVFFKMGAVKKIMTLENVK